MSERDRDRGRQYRAICENPDYEKEARKGQRKDG